MRLWVDDIRPAPTGFIWVKSVREAIAVIRSYERNLSGEDIIVISLDHDAGDFAREGGNYIQILNWLEKVGNVDTGYFFHLHSMNPVGVENMKRIIEKNGWREIRRLEDLK